MTIDQLFDKQAIIITLDVDSLLYEKLQQIIHVGFNVVEINCIDRQIMSNVLRDFPMLRIGVGNITDVQQLEVCQQIGVHFTTSPGFTPAIAQTAALYAMNYLPGVATISEAMQAMYLGLNNLRPFPADLRFCTMLNKCLPAIRLFPAEVVWEEIELFLNLPTVTAVSSLNPEIQQLQAVRELRSCLVNRCHANTI